MALIKLGLLSVIILVAITEVANGITLDELIALAGRMTHGAVNPNGLFGPSGKRSPDGRGILKEYDIMVPLSSNEGRLIALGRRVGAGRNPFRGKRAAISRSGAFWTSAQIPYTISSSFSSSQRSTIETSMEEFTKFTCIRWSPRSSQSNYVSIQAQDGCWSYIGKTGSTSQVLSLGTNCVVKSVIVHEMMHAAGVFHQQSRSDRDSFVIINEENIRDGFADNFDIANNQNAFGVPYDYRSVMHYGRKAFSKDNSDTITTIDSSFQDVIGKAPTMGFNDIRLLNTMYNCNSGCSSVTCPSGGYQAEDCNCYCPSGNPSNPVTQCGGTTTTPPSCNSVGQDCDCGSRSGACSGLSNTVCSSGACVCASGFELVNGRCQEETTGGNTEYILDGSSVSPFNVVSGTWRLRSGTDNSAFGIPSNNRYIFTSGRGSSSTSEIESPTESSGRWCLSYSAQFSNVRVTVSFITSSGTETFPVRGTSRSYITRSYSQTSSGSIKVKITASAYRNRAWSVRLDTIKFAQC